MKRSTPALNRPASDFAQEISYSDGLIRDADLLDMMPAGVCVFDLSGMIWKYNRQAVKLWGREPKIGDKDERFSGAFRLYHPDGTPLAHNQSPVAASLKDGLLRRDVELIMERPNLSRIIVSLSVIPIRDKHSKLTGVFNFFYDITVQRELLRESESKLRAFTSTLEKKVEVRTAELQLKNEELKKSEERYHKMVDEVEDYAILLLDKNGIIQNWNKGAEKIKGYKEDEIIGKSISVFYLPDDREKGLPAQLIKQAMEKGKALHEGWRLRKDGSRFWGSIVITALHDENNNVTGFSKVTRDLTEKKMAEDKLNHYAGELEFQNKELQQFAYAAAHDMKEPLRKIRFYNSSILERLAAEMPEKEKDYLNRSIRAVERMDGLIDDLLLYSKASADVRQFEDVDLKKIVDEVILLHRETIEDTGAVIKTENLPVIQGISFQMVQLFDNLVGNALKYRHPQRRPQITIASKMIQASGMNEEPGNPHNEYCKITVSDNGIGFDQAYADKIFELFHRLHGNSQYTGSGVGLTICKRIVQNHHGIIKAIGKPGEGTTFNIYLLCSWHVGVDVLID